MDYKKYQIDVVQNLTPIQWFLVASLSCCYNPKLANWIPFILQIMLNQNNSAVRITS